MRLVLSVASSVFLQDATPNGSRSAQSVNNGDSSRGYRVARPRLAGMAGRRVVAAVEGGGSGKRKFGSPMSIAGAPG